MSAIGRVITGGSTDRRLLWIAASMLAVDVVLILLFLLWAIAGHYELRNIWTFGRDEFSMAEGRLTEQWGFVKLALASVFLVMIAGFQRQVFFWGLTALLMIMLLSDSLQFHEHINAAFHPPLSAILERREVDVLTKFALAAAPLSAMAYGLWSAPAPNRPQMLWLATPAIALGFWTSIVDFIHNLVEAHFDSGRTIGNLIEEGGEGLLITAVLVSSFFYLWRIHLRGDPAIARVEP